MQVSHTLIDIVHDSGYDMQTIGETEKPAANFRFTCPGYSEVWGEVVFRHYRTSQRLTHAKAKRLLETWGPGGLGESDCSGLEASVPHA